VPWKERCGPCLDGEKCRKVTAGLGEEPCEEFGPAGREEQLDLVAVKGLAEDYLVDLKFAGTYHSKGFSAGVSLGDFDDRSAAAGAPADGRRTTKGRCFAAVGVRFHTDVMPLGLHA
jgi:hypothetical protein